MAKMKKMRSDKATDKVSRKCARRSGRVARKPVVKSVSQARITSTGTKVRVSPKSPRLTDTITKKSGTQSQSNGTKTTDIKARKPPKFSWVVEGLLAGHGRPTLPGHIQFLCDNQITYLVTLTLNRPRALLELPASLQWVHIPIQDETPPSVEQIKQFVSLVDKAKSEGKRVSVHCAWGRGRTGTMLACYLAKIKNLSTAEAIEAIRELRPGSVDTEKQKNAIQLYLENKSL